MLDRAQWGMPMKTTTAISEETIRQIEILSRDGMRVYDIAKKLYVSDRTVSRYRKKLGIAAFERKPLTEEELVQAKRLLEDGANYAEVGRTIGRSSHAIRNHFPGYSWSLQECSRLGLAIRWNKI